MQPGSTPRRSLLLPLLLGLGLTLATLIAPPAARAEDQGFLVINKSVSGFTEGQTVTPGETFVYTITIGCDNIGSGGCTNAVLTDTLPEGLSLDGDASNITIGPAGAGTASVDGDTVTVTFTQPLTDPPDGQGILDGATVTVQIPVVVDEDISPELSGTDLVNTAEVDGTNTDPVDDSFIVVPDVPIDLAASTDKSFSPATGIASPGTTTDMTLTGGNASNVAVDEIVISDPATPPGAAFDSLALTGTVDVTLPAGAEQVQVDVWVNGAWINGPPGPPPAVLPDLPPGTDLEEVQGIRVHFISTDDEGIPPGVSGSIDVEVEQREGITPGTITNEVSTTVTDEGVTSDATTATGSYEVTTSAIDLEASKSFSPNPIVVGDESTVTIGAENTSDLTLDSLTLTEPGGDPNMFENGLTFSGWGDVQWPTGATGAEVTFTCADGSTPSDSTTTVDTLPDPPAGCEVVGFSVTFTGPIVAGAEASLGFTVTADEEQPAEEVEHPNTVQAGSTAPGGFEGTDDAEDTLVTIAERLDIVVDKRISPASIPSIPGQDVVVLLSGKVSDFPTSTADADQIIVADPTDPTDSAWYDCFQPTAITETPVPAGSTLTVQYWNGTDWVDVPGMVDIPGEAILNAPLPAEVVSGAGGIRFVYDSENGFPPGTEVNPNITFELTGECADQDIEVENCAAASASAVDVPDANDAQVPPNCPVINLEPADPGDFDMLSKSWDVAAVGERTGQEAGVTLRWSTAGLSDIDQMVISDIPNPSVAGLPDSVYDVFDLVRIDPITSAQDPWLTYDQVTRVELFSRSAGAWVPAPNDPCPAACDGTFPGYTLDATAQADTIAFRLVYEESPTRADRIGGNPTAPAVGSGVARSSDNDRQLHAVFRLRDELRSDPTVPVLAESIYNVAGQIGEVLDTAGADAVVDGTVYTGDEASDIITITPVSVTADLSKEWTGSPVGVPHPNDADFPDEYPTTRVTLRATNTTPRDVDQMVITDPVGPNTPFDAFNLRGFVTITAPGDIGATDLGIELTRENGSTASFGRDEVLAMTEADLADVVGIRATYEGRIAGAATAVLTFDLRLREDVRSTGVVPVPAPAAVDNDAGLTVSDLLDYPGVDPEISTDQDGAQVQLDPAGIDIVVTKTFEPDEQTEPDNGPIDVTLAGEVVGPTRTAWMALVDEDPHFFNQYDLVGFGDFAFTAPVDRVQVDAFTGGTFSVNGAGDVERTGGSWVNGAAPGTALVLPDGVAWPDVQGVRFTFLRADGDHWENPSQLTQPVTVVAQRRADLRTGGPVPSDLDGNSPAPGEPAAGVATNAVQGENRSLYTVGGQPLTATDEASDTILYRHAINAVEVTKGPSGAQSPSQSIPYVLTFTNTGDVPITNPVITDRIPSDAIGPQLILNPDLEEGQSPYTFTLDGAAPAPPSGLPMPEDPAQVTVDEQSTLLTFTFPPGTVLEIGQEYTITVDMVFRPGLPSSTPVTNTAGITGDRPWDECDDTLDPSGECQAETTVNPIRAGALRGVKSVRAAQPGLGVLNTRNDPRGCIPDLQGFFTGGCVPLTEAGTDEVWRLAFTNTGNLPQDRVFAIDRLPIPGDTGAILVQAERGSQWRPIPKSVRYAGVSGGQIETIRISYDTDQDLCTDDLLPNQACPEGAWTPLGAFPLPQVGDSLDLPAEATAIRIETQFGDPLFQPTGFVMFDVTTTTPSQSPTAGPDTIAWNTVAAAARTVDGADLGYTPRTEGNKVGVALATGPIEIVKVVQGPAAEYAPTEFPVTLECTSVGEPVDLGDRANLTLVPDVPQRVDDLPYGATCTVAEDTAAVGDPDFEATTVTVVRDDQTVPIVIATNTYPDASLVLRKAIADGAVDQDGNPLVYGPFTFDVTCTYLGQPVFAAGHSVDDPMTATFTSEESVTFTELPAGSQCTATESFTGGAIDTSSSATTGQGTPDEETTTGDTSIDLVLTPDGEGAVATNEVTFENTFPTGAVTITKQVDGAGADSFGTGPFQVRLTCVSVADEDRVVYDGLVSLGGFGPMSVTIDHLYVDSMCTVTETMTGGATTSSVSPDTPFPVTGDSAAQPVVVTVTNTFDVGGLVVGKLLLADRELPDDISFTMQVECVVDVDGEEQLVDFGSDNEFTLSPTTGMVATFENIPVGAVCTITETDDGGADSSIVVPERVVIEADQYAAVIVANVFTGGGELPDTGGPGARLPLLGLLLILLGATAVSVSRRNQARQQAGR